MYDLIFQLWKEMSNPLERIFVIFVFGCGIALFFKWASHLVKKSRKVD